ncbi:peptidase inhibitor family I36 protein [Actinomadura oligospora]|uniref:peptidase inhibitor family I36 protein n=1 Tax=Actinomadura oligospora TaxID=111804 RepID=UPI00047E7C84|nr:peptidase inhibitor family I36 protein [Actinomadura oligospora]
MRSIRLTTAALLLTAGTGLVHVPSAASASGPTGLERSAAPAVVRSWDDCPQGRMCVWRLPNGHGSRGSFAKVARDLNELGGGLNDHVMSFWNRTGRTWCMFAEAHFGGEHRKYPHEPLLGAKGNTGRFGYQVSSLHPTFLGLC